MTSVAPSRPSFREHFAKLLADVPAVAQYRIVDLEASEPPWFDTGLAVDTGDQVTLLLCGRIYLDEAADLWLDPALQVWCRVGDRGPIVRGSRHSHTFASPHDGTIQLGNVNPAEWTDRNGAIALDPALYAFMSGGTTVVVVRWAPGADPVAALRALGTEGDFDGIVAGEVERIEHGRGAAPEEWEHLWFLGPTEVYRDAQPGVIACSSENNFAIIRHQTEEKLTPDTTLSWTWKVDQLPSTVAEDTFATHDYLSIAVEFDDGLDLTYQWSAGLAPESSYRCPLPHWSERETHLVVRSGLSHLGQWLQEKRNVYADRRRAIGGPDPGRITGVWLIAVSFLQHGKGRCAYSGITLANGTTSYVL